MKDKWIKETLGPPPSMLHNHRYAEVRTESGEHVISAWKHKQTLESTVGPHLKETPSTRK
jgi:hypothetical protein